MALIPLDPPPGINSDDTSFSATGRWVDGNCVRFWHGKPQSIGGWAQGVIGAIAGTPRNFFAYMAEAGIGSLIIGTDARLYTAIGGFGPPVDISPVSFGLLGGSWGWTFGTFGTSLMAAPVNGSLHVYAGSGVATLVTQAPTSICAGIVTVPQRQVIAFACNEEISGTVNKRCIRGCDIEDYSDWTTTSSNNAFEYILDDSGEIVRGVMVGETLAVFTTNSLFVGTYIGDPAQTWRFDRVEGGLGLAAAFTLAVDGQAAYWLTPDLRWMMWAPGAPPVRIEGTMENDFRANCGYGTLGNARAFYNRAFQEVWLFYTDSRDVGNENTRYIAFSTAGQGWHKGQLARSAAYDAGGLVLDPVTSPASTVFMGERTTNKVWSHEHTYSIGSSATHPVWSLTSADQYLEEGQRRVMIRGVRPDFKTQPASIDLTLATKQYPQSSAITKGPYVLTAGATKKDFRASGRLVSVKLSPTSNSTSCPFRLGKLEFDTVALGQR